MADKANEFETAAKEDRKGLVAEYLEFLRAEKKYWLIPLIAVVLLLTLIATLGGTAAAPFIYTLF